MAKATLKKIVSASMPGWELVEGSSRHRGGSDGPPAGSDQVGVDMDALRRKNLKPNRSLDAKSPDDQTRSAPSHATRLARVRNSNVPVDSPVGSKAVLVDETVGKIIGKQG